MTTVYYVAKFGSDTASGSKQEPFLSINHAAQVALPGDTVIVREGVYREWVKPKHAGLSDLRRITYQAAENEKVVIKGSEEIKNWEQVEGNVWRVVLDNAFFGDYNPYKTVLEGDWLIYRSGLCHTGDVYLNGMSFYEVENYKDLLEPEAKTEVFDHWTRTIVPVKNVSQTQYVWYTEGDEETTTIYANFQGANPNEELVEINVRRSCFYPEENGINYITVRGFEMCQAATPWTPPTADQPGLLGPNWSKGWIIEDNIIHDSKCSGISIGKEKRTGHNYRTTRRDKPGYQYQLESVYMAKRFGWSEESIGSHIIRNNIIYDCGQNGIVGHLGCIFSEIYGNHIYNIAIKREFYGHEIAGIKLHAAIDVQIQQNAIHDCSLGLWLDWQAQGARINENVFYKNQRDFFIEVTHGPHVVDHNIFASEYAVDNHAQGTAYVRNIFAGKMEVKKIMDRSTPYHLPHSTELAGYAKVYSGDDRFYQNIFIGNKDNKVGTKVFEGYPDSLESFIKQVDEHGRFGDHSEFEKVEQPVYAADNAYFIGAKAKSDELRAINLSSFDPKLAIVEEEDGIYLEINLPNELADRSLDNFINLPRTRVVDAEFDLKDGTLIEIQEGFSLATKGTGNLNCEWPVLEVGENKVKVFSFEKQ